MSGCGQNVSTGPCTLLQLLAFVFASDLDYVGKMQNTWAEK